MCFYSHLRGDMVPLDSSSMKFFQSNTIVVLEKNAKEDVMVG